MRGDRDDVAYKEKATDDDQSAAAVCTAQDNVPAQPADNQPYADKETEDFTRQAFWLLVFFTT